MKSRPRKTFRSWMFIYAGLFASVVFASQEPAPTLPNSVHVPPAAADAQFLAIQPGAIDSRSDI